MGRDGLGGPDAGLTFPLVSDLRLGSVYGVVLAEPVPDDWLSLLRNCEIGDGGIGQSDSSISARGPRSAT